jgi:hypothetical protein
MKLSSANAPRNKEPCTEEPWTIIRQHLDQALSRVCEEIRSYPAPIPACDAQFNYLLDERATLSSELARVRKLMCEDCEFMDARSAIEAFLNSSAHLGESLKRDVRALIENERWQGECEQ